MKKFIFTILCVSVFFIGIGSIIEKTSAKFNSDEKALELIKKARIAIGGEANIESVRSMTIVGTTTNFFEKAGIQDVKQGNLEINMQLPGQFSKIVKIGDPGNATGDGEIHKSVDVFVVRGDGENVDFSSGDGTNKKGVFIVKKGDGENLNIETETDGKIKIEDNKLIIKKQDGTTEEINIDDNKKMVWKKDSDGKIITEDIIGQEGTKTVVLKSADGKVITENIIGQDDPAGIKMKLQTQNGGNQNEMLRTTIALLMTAPKGMDVIYTYAGMGNIDGYQSNIIDVSANGSSFKLYLDAATNLPQMVSYKGQGNVFFIKKEGLKDMTKEQLVEMKKKFAEPVEHQIKFSDFRNVGNLTLPYSWTEIVDNKQTQNVNITNYEFNPANIGEKFNKSGVFVTKMKIKADN